MPIKHPTRQGEFIHGRIDGKDFEILNTQGRLFIVFADRSMPPQELQPQVDLKQRFYGVSVTVSKSTPHGSYELSIGRGVPFIFSNDYIFPHTAESPEERAWLLLQEYKLNNDYSDAPLATMLDALEDILGKIEERHPQEEAALDEIFSLADTHKFNAAIRRIRQLINRIDGQAPAEAPTPESL